eukprot:CAMPEP_0194047320 /NCGR_PEP_ID=MMETSP0009_2-20130614/23984_1 /TAXON_ID=210454 /ORGANISM="Grammatophora oceanica, Strain CCMP 410" /LENGTH=43 /DNA_ID= /DNA_START= /DNA_END= /DNA_ORIENTATION=
MSMAATPTCLAFVSSERELYLLGMESNVELITHHDYLGKKKTE